MTGVAIFATGFVIWNIDNAFCSTLTGWKIAIGWPAAFFLEGLLGVGVYLSGGLDLSCRTLVVACLNCDRLVSSNHRDRISLPLRQGRPPTL